MHMQQGETPLQRQGEALLVMNSMRPLLSLIDVPLFFLYRRRAMNHSLIARVSANE